MGLMELSHFAWLPMKPAKNLFLTILIFAPFLSLFRPQCGSAPSAFQVLFLQSADKQLLSTKPLQRIYKELQRCLSSACFAGYENISVQMEQRL